MSISFRRGWSIKDVGNAVVGGVETVVDAVSGAKWHNPVKGAGEDFKETGAALLDTGDDFLRQLGNELMGYGQALIDAAINNSKATVYEILEAIEEWWKEKWKEARSYYEKKLEIAFNEFIKEYEDSYNDIQKQFAEAIDRAKDFINSLQEILDIKKLIQKILDQAEIMLEDYLREKIKFLEVVNSKGEPNIEISLDGTTIRFELFVYVVLMDYDGVDYEKECFLELSLFLEQDISKPAPKANLNMKFYVERITTELKERIEEKMTEEKDKLVEELVIALFSDYITVFNQFKKYLDLI